MIFTDGDTARVRPADEYYSFAEVPFEWPHDDTEHWVSEFSDNYYGTRDGEFSEFSLVPEFEQTDRLHKLSVRNTADRGVRTVFFGAVAPAETCEFGFCSGIERVTSTTLNVVDE